MMQVRTCWAFCDLNEKFPFWSKKKKKKKKEEEEEERKAFAHFSLSIGIDNNFLIKLFGNSTTYLLWSVCFKS